MKKHMTKLLKAAFAAALVSSAALPVSAQGIHVSEFLMWINRPEVVTTNVYSQADEIFFLVVMEEADASAPNLALDPETAVPYLSFQLGGVAKTAEFVGFRPLYSTTGNDAMLFRYVPAASDYGAGIKLPTSDFPGIGGFSRNAIGLGDETHNIRNTLVAGSVLPRIDQYTHVLADGFNTGSAPYAPTAADLFVNMFKIESSDSGGVSIITGNSLNVPVRRHPSAVGNTGPIELIASSADPTICTVTATGVIPGGSMQTQFAVTGVTPGSTTVTIKSKEKPNEFVVIPVTVSLTGTAKAVVVSPDELIVGEDPDAFHRVRIQLGASAPTGAVFNVTGYAGNISGDPTVVINPGQSSGSFNVVAPDGRQETTLTITDAAHNYNVSYLRVIVTNVAPVIETPVADPAQPGMSTPVNIYAGDEYTFNFSATDKAQTFDSLSYNWNFGHGAPAVRTASGPLPWDAPFTGRASGEVSHLYDTEGQFNAVLVVNDEDGGRATRSVPIIVHPGVRLFLQVMQSPYAGLTGLGTGRMEYVNRTLAWDPALGNTFGENASVRARAIPDPGSYRFAWRADSGLTAEDQRMPAPTPEEGDVSIKLGTDDLTVRYLFSREFYPGDGFGDADADALGDTWESVYFGYGQSAQIGTTAATVPSGDWGRTGNIDADYMPSAPLTWVTNRIEGGTVQVFDYPITDHGGAGWNWNGYLPDPAGGNAFDNFREFRGLLERRPGKPEMAYAVENLTDPLDPLRGNSPGTNPALADTDGDGMGDGWEFYFWTTIMYEVNHRNWRAWDPTFGTYDPEDTSESGLPILSGDDTVVTNSIASETFTVVISNWFFRPSLTVTFTNGTEYVLGETSEDLISITAGTNNTLTVNVTNILVGSDYVLSYNEYGGTHSKEALLALFDPMTKNGDPASDIDQDGLYDWEECLLGTNPLHWDTDGDGMPDGWEVERGLDPLNGDRIGTNANGANGNPDQDYMAGGGDIKHLRVYIEDYINETYWNGREALPFNPDLAWNGGAAFTNLEEFRVAEYYVQMGLVDSVDKDNWLAYTTDPCDNDSDQDGMPDGWELYVGLDPIPSVPELGFPVVELAEESKLVSMGFPPDMLDTTDPATGETTKLPMYGSPFLKTGEGALSALEKFANVTATAIRAADETVVVDGVTAIRRHFQNPNPTWTNKTRPCDPWNLDTDGDGLADGLEFRESILVDPNRDGSNFVNLDPCSVDTDGDQLPDGWEYAMGIISPDHALDVAAAPGTGGTNQPPAAVTNIANFIYGGVYDDPDGDGFPNYQEYLSGAVYGWRYDKWYAPGDVKYRIPDPDYPTYTGFRTFRPYDPSDFFLPAPKPTELHYGYTALNEIHTNLFGIPIAPDTDNMTLLAKTYEILRDPGYINTYTNVTLPGTNLLDTAESSRRAGVVAAARALENLLEPAEFHYGLKPASWDPAVEVIPGVPFYFIAPLRGGNQLADGSPFYATMHPRNADTDYDGMQDYWEVFHGLNPLYGGYPGDEKYDVVARDSQPAARSQVSAGQASRIISDYQWGVGSYPGEARLQVFLNEMTPYDFEKKPWQTGSPHADCDMDGIDNWNESYNLHAPDVLSNTDPSPYWFTDMSYDNGDGNASMVNNYFTTGSLYMNGLWWWSLPMHGVMMRSPAYMFDFELNEGYDTDNDNIPDRIELAGDGDRGVTDPLDFDFPRSRKAMYLDGNSATRTRHPYHHDNWALTSYSVELWFRAQQPVGRGNQTLIERPVMAPIDPRNPSGSGTAIRRTFRVSINNAGRIFVELDNDALATFSTETTGTGGTISADTWYHLAVTMDSVNNKLNIYLDGQLAKSVACDLKPCTGTFALSGVTDPSTGITRVSYVYHPAPIVVGASDANPLASVGGDDLNYSEPVLFDKFKGWVDEIRIWDRVRTQQQIQQDMRKRYDRRDVAAVNDYRFAWEQRNLASATMLSDFPQKLLYHFTFDNLPDVVPAADRDPNAFIPSADTDEVPAGFTDPGFRRPDASVYPGIGWWYGSGLRSRVYNKTYLYVPIIENTAAHLRRYPPVDVKSMIAVYDGNYNFLGYRWRTPADWLRFATSIDGRTVDNYNPVEVGAAFDIDPAYVPNSANPYGVSYFTAVAYEWEKNPEDFPGKITHLNNYEYMPFYTDMVPLVNAVADLDVPFATQNSIS